MIYNRKTCYIGERTARTKSDRVESLASAVAKAAPDFDEEQQSIALSVCPTTAETISLEVAPSGVLKSSYPDVVVSFLLPDRDFDADVIQSFCHFVHFFSSPGAGEAWSANHPGTFLLLLDEAFELGRRVNALNFPAAFGDGR
jgi:hypothetical protein